MRSWSGLAFCFAADSAPALACASPARSWPLSRVPLLPRSPCACSCASPAQTVSSAMGCCCELAPIGDAGGGEGWWKVRCVVGLRRDGWRLLRESVGEGGSEDGGEAKAGGSETCEDGVAPRRGSPSSAWGRSSVGGDGGRGKSDGEGVGDSTNERKEEEPKSPFGIDTRRREKLGPLPPPLPPLLP